MVPKLDGIIKCRTPRLLFFTCKETNPLPPRLPTASPLAFLHSSS